MAEAQRVEADLLVVGGSESAVAAAVQAARLGVKRVVLVSDLAMLGGQFSAEGVGNVDEWTTVNGKRTEFPRSGIFLEVARAIDPCGRAAAFVRRGGFRCVATAAVSPREQRRLFQDFL